MAELMLPNYLQAAREGQARGQQRGLASLMGQALQQPDQRQALIGKMAGVDPGAAMQAQQHFDSQAASQKNANRDRLVQLSEVMLKAPQMAAQVYPEFRASLSAELGPNVNLPEQFDPGALDAARAFVSAQQDNTPAAIRELQMLQANPELADLDMRRRTAGFDRPKLIETDQGYAWATPQGATPLNYGAGGQAEQPSVQRALAMLAGQPGAQMTSGLRTPERNAAVGGVPNSQHLKGTAGDYAVPHAQKASFIANARQQGFEAIDEGDHVHVELPGKASSRVMPAAKDRGPGALQEKLDLARQMGASPDQLRQMVLGESGGGKPSATQIKLANTAKAKLIDLKAMEDQLARVDASFRPLRGSYSAGIGGGLLPTEDGKRFDASVALLKGMARKLTRTPGEGAMSDYESRLAELANPSRGEYENVTADQIEQLRALIKTTREGYEALLQDAGGNSGNLPGSQKAAPGGWSIQKVGP